MMYIRQRAKRFTIDSSITMTRKIEQYPYLIHVEFFRAIKAIKLIDDMEKLSCLSGPAMRIIRLVIKYSIAIDVRVLRDM